MLEAIQRDPRVLIESAFSILDKDSKLAPFVFNTVQDIYWPSLSNRDIILKARKMGFSTLRLGRMLAKCAILKNRRCVLVSHEAKATERLLGRAHHMIDTSVVPIKTGSKGLQTITFPETGSSIWIGTAGSQAFGRGDDITDYHLSELAFWENPGIITGIEEACVNDSEGCIESTANGFGTPFHRLWERAVTGTKDEDTGLFYTPHFFPWFLDPTYCVETDPLRPLEGLDAYERMLREGIQHWDPSKNIVHKLSDGQILWRRNKRKAMYDPNLFEQEYPATPEEAFLQAGLMVFDANAIRAHAANARAAQWIGEISDSGA